jgi:hypothetical protein
MAGTGASLLLAPPILVGMIGCFSLLSGKRRMREALTVIAITLAFGLAGMLWADIGGVSSWITGTFF